MGEGLGRAAARLTRLSFADGDRAGKLLAGEPLRWWHPERNEPTSADVGVVLAAIGRTADPDAVVAALADMAGAPDGAELRAMLEASKELRVRLLGLLGVSLELAAHLRAEPGDWRVLLGDLDSDGVPARLAAAVGADAGDPGTRTGGPRAAPAGMGAGRPPRGAHPRGGGRPAPPGPPPGARP